MSESFLFISHWSGMLSTVRVGLIFSSTATLSRTQQYLPHNTLLLQERCFSPRTKRGKGGKKDNQPLTNEHLIRSILSRAGTESSPESVQVRLVVDKGHGNPPEIEIVSLDSAMGTSRDLEVDLVAVSLEQDVPVVKAVDLSRLMYEKSKRKKASGGSSKGGSKSVKEYKFKAGIADNDMARKAENMIKYLEKGHEVKVTITSSRFNLRQDSDALNTTLGRIREMLGDHVTEPKAKKGNVAGTFATMIFLPNTQKAK